MEDVILFQLFFYKTYLLKKNKRFFKRVVGAGDVANWVENPGLYADRVDKLQYYNKRL